MDDERYIPSNRTVMAHRYLTVRDCGQRYSLLYGHVIRKNVDCRNDYQ